MAKDAPHFFFIFSKIDDDLKEKFKSKDENKDKEYNWRLNREFYVDKFQKDLDNYKNLLKRRKYQLENLEQKPLTKKQKELLQSQNPSKEASLKYQEIEFIEKVLEIELYSKNEDTTPKIQKILEKFLGIKPYNKDKIQNLKLQEIIDEATVLDLKTKYEQLFYETVQEGAIKQISKDLLKKIEEERPEEIKKIEELAKQIKESDSIKERTQLEIEFGEAVKKVVYDQKLFPHIEFHDKIGSGDLQIYNKQKQNLKSIDLINYTQCTSRADLLKMFFEKYLNRIILHGWTKYHVHAGLILSDNSVYSLEQKKMLDYDLDKGGIQIIGGYNYFIGFENYSDINFTDYETGSVLSEIEIGTNLENWLVGDSYKDNQLEIKYLVNVNNSRNDNKSNGRTIPYVSLKKISRELVKKFNHKTGYRNPEFIKAEFSSQEFNTQTEKGKKDYFENKYEGAARILETDVNNSDAWYDIYYINKKPEEKKYIDYPVELE